MRIVVRALAALVLLCGAAQAEEGGPVQVTGGVQYEFLAHWDVDRLNQILSKDSPAFLGVDPGYTAAQTAVSLYRVTYASVVPERGNKPIVATGLLALPEGATGSLPVLSYQHGTVYGKEQVPSFPEQSPETQLAIAQFGGQGYAVMGADYFGMGASDEPEGYMVKASHQQATFDMLMAGQAVMESLGVERSKLFLGGWSQGGFVTLALLQKLEQAGVPVAAAATASAPTDVAAALSGFLDFPRPNDADWVGTLFILSAFAFENYYGVPGLARSLIAEEYYEAARKAYAREPFEVSALTTDLRKLLRPEYFDRQYFAASAYGRLVAGTEVYRWIYETPVRTYYGEADEAISVGIGRLAMTYQQAIGAGNPQVEAVSTGETGHRGTYAVAVPQWKAWFDSLR